MLTETRAGPYSVRGLSVGGIYTSLHIKQLDLLLDVGIAPRSFAGANTLVLSHCHADHVGALMSLVGARMLLGNRKLRIVLPAPVVGEISDMLAVIGRLQRHEVNVELIPVEPGDVVPLHSNIHVEAVQSFHPVASLAYLFTRRVKRLRAEFSGLDGSEIKRRRLAGDDLFDVHEHLELGYCTDTLVKALDEEPRLYDVKTLIIEATFLDERKSVADAHRSCHIHLDELLERADRFRNEAILLMHFSQIYKPQEVREILERRCPPELRERVRALLPRRAVWPG